MYNAGLFLQNENIPEIEPCNDDPFPKGQIDYNTMPNPEIEHNKVENNNENYQMEKIENINKLEDNKSNCSFDIKNEDLQGNEFANLSEDEIQNINKNININTDESNTNNNKNEISNKELQGSNINDNKSSALVNKLNKNKDIIDNLNCLRKYKTFQITNKSNSNNVNYNNNYISSSIEQVCKALSNKTNNQNVKAYKPIKTCNNNNNSITPNQFDVEYLSYKYLKEMSKIKINKDENFMMRMVFDIMQRQTKEKKLNILLEQSKVKMDENKRIKGFNRLIEDANRRLETQDQIELLKKKFEDAKLKKSKKFYKNDEWNDIYKKRFMTYLENKESKITQKVLKKREEERLKEEEEEKLCKTKKENKEVIDTYTKRLYDERFKKQIKTDRKFKKNIKNETTINSKISNNKLNNSKIKNSLINSYQKNNININSSFGAVTENNLNNDNSKFNQNLKNILNDEEEDEEIIRNVPNPINNNNNNIKHKITRKSTKILVKHDNKNKCTIEKLNPSDFIPKMAGLHVDEIKADKIVNEFFTKNLY